MDGSAVQSTDCPCGGPGFSAQHACDSSQQPGTPVPGDPVFWPHQAQGTPLVHMHTFRLMQHKIEIAF